MPREESSLPRPSPPLQTSNPESTSGSEPQAENVTIKSADPEPARDQVHASAGLDAHKTSIAGSSGEPAASEKGGFFGSLTLERMHATGHAVWLYLPLDGVKLKCNELIHMHRTPEQPDLTYFRGDLSRPLKLEKVELVQDLGSPDRGKIKSVTNIWTIDATMYDKGFGFDSADIVANGPGRLETQPDRDQPIERIAIWQDKLEVQNDVDSDGKIKQKIVLLTGKRPCFIDNARGSSIDSADSIKVLLAPKVSQPAPEVLASRDADSGGGLEMKRLLAFRDVHLLATSKTLTAQNTLMPTSFNCRQSVSPPPCLPLLCLLSRPRHLIPNTVQMRVPQAARRRKSKSSPRTKLPKHRPKCPWSGRLTVSGLRSRCRQSRQRKLRAVTRILRPIQHPRRSRNRVRYRATQAVRNPKSARPGCGVLLLFTRIRWKEKPGGKMHLVKLSTSTTVVTATRSPSYFSES